MTGESVECTLYRSWRVDGSNLWCCTSACKYIWKSGAEYYPVHPTCTGVGGKEVFHGNKEVVELINSVQFDWDKIVETLIDFLNNGAGNMLSSTLTAAKSIISGVSTFVIAFLFAIYILLQKKKLGIQAKKVLFAFIRRGRAEAVVEVSSLTYSTFSSFLTGQCLEAVILGSMFVLAMTIFRLPYALLVGIFIAFTALIPIFGAFLGCA